MAFVGADGRTRDTVMNRSEAREQPKSASDSNSLGRYQHLRRLWLFAGIAVLAALLLVVSTAWRGEFSSFIEAFGAAQIRPWQ